MSKDSLTVLYFDLANKSSYKKNHTDYYPYLGGVGLSYKIIEDNPNDDPLVLAVGPLSGVFPYVSKTCVTFLFENQLKEYYIGGRLAASLRFAAIDAVVFLKHSKKNVFVDASSDTDIISPRGNSFEIHPESTVLGFENDSMMVDGHFSISANVPYRKFVEKGIKRFSVFGDSSVDIEDAEGYAEAYNDILDMVEKVSVKPSINPSCSGCPMGCEFADRGEIGTSSYLSHCLVSCTFADEIYNDIPTVYKCLSSLGYSYTHEDIEFIEGKIGDSRTVIYEKIDSGKLEAE